MIISNTILISRRHLVFVIGIFLLLSGCEGSPIGTNDYRAESSQKYPSGLRLPRIIVETPENGTIIGSAIKDIAVTGIVEQGDNLITGFLVNGEALEIESDGTFNTMVSLPDDGSRFAGIELIVKDSLGYWKREYIAVLRGGSASAKQYARDAIGFCFRKGMTKRAIESISPMINEILSREDLIENVSDLVAGFSIPIKINNPFKVALELFVSDINVLNDSEFRINKLMLKCPLEETGSAGLLGEISIRGLEIDIGVRMTSLFGIPSISDSFQQSIKIRMVDDIDILADLRFDAPDRHTIRIDVINVDMDISDLTIAFPDSIIFESNPIKIKGGIARLVSLVLSRLLTTMLDIPIFIPKDPVNLGMVNHMGDGLSIPLFKGQEPLDIGEMIDADFSDMYLAYGIGGFFGSANHFGAGLDMVAWSRSHDEVIDLPPTISIEDALVPSEGIVSDLAVAVSGNFMNRMVGALAGIKPEFFIPGSDILSVLLPGMELPDNTGIKIRLDTPIVLEFKDGRGVISAANIKVEFYMGSLDESGLQACMAFNIKARVNADVFFQDGESYLNFDLMLPKFEVVYLVDRVGISRILDMEDVIDTLAPQLIDTLRGILNIPLRISFNEMTGLLPDFPLPEATAVVQEIRMDGGYVSVFVDVKK